MTEPQSQTQAPSKTGGRRGPVVAVVIVVAIVIASLGGYFLFFSSSSKSSGPLSSSTWTYQNCLTATSSQAFQNCANAAPGQFALTYIAISQTDSSSVQFEIYNKGGIPGELMSITWDGNTITPSQWEPPAQGGGYQPLLINQGQSVDASIQPGGTLTGQHTIVFGFNGGATLTATISL